MAFRCMKDVWLRLTKRGHCLVDSDVATASVETQTLIMKAFGQVYRNKWGVMRRVSELTQPGASN